MLNPGKWNTNSVVADDWAKLLGKLLTELPGKLWQIEKSCFGLPVLSVVPKQLYMKRVFLPEKKDSIIRPVYFFSYYPWLLLLP